MERLVDPLAAAPVDRTSLAAFRVLVAVARADGTLDDAEIAALRTTLGDRADFLPALLAEDVDLDAELALLSIDDKDRVYQSAFAICYADGVAATAEVDLLRRIIPNRGEESVLGQVFGETLDTLVPGRIVAEPDPVQRDQEITEDILKYSVLAAVAGAMPVPGVGIVADLAVVALQSKMVLDIGEYLGHRLDREATRSFITSVAGSTVMRVAVNNLARFVPGWGSAWGAATSFATTYAIGRAAQRYFESGRELRPHELTGLYEAARSEGARHFHASAAQIARTHGDAGKRLATLNEQLVSGELSRAQYDEAVGSLLPRPSA
jgi:uncharacterized protein (DUF697 family)/uncharacterized tellurite resistance protein B-like protein